MGVRAAVTDSDPSQRSSPPVSAYSYRAAQIHSDEDLQTWQLLRRSVYLEEGLLTAEDLDESIFSDVYDGYSEHFLTWDNRGEPVASARLILGSPSAGESLQVEDSFGVAPLPNSAEISGFAVVKEHRTGLAQVALMRALFERLRELEIDHCYAEVEPWFYKALQKFGYPVSQISESRFVFNAENFVIYMLLDDFWSGARSDIAEQKRTLRGTYYSHPWDGTISRQHFFYHAG